MRVTPGVGRDRVGRRPRASTLRTEQGPGGLFEKIDLLDTLARVSHFSLKRIIFGVARGRAKSAAYCAGSQPFQRLSRRDMAGEGREPRAGVGPRFGASSRRSERSHIYLAAL